MIIKVLDSSFDLFLEEHKEEIREYPDKIIVYDALGLCSHLLADKIKYYSRSSFKAPVGYQLYIKFKNKFYCGSHEFQDLFQVKDFIKLDKEVKGRGICTYYGYEYISGIDLTEYKNYSCELSAISKKGDITSPYITSLQEEN